MLDTLGAGIAGSASKEVDLSRTALRTAQGVAAADQGVSLWGTPARVPALSAAFINGVAAHAFELDDSGGCDHSGAVVVPAVFAAAALAAQPVSGERMLLATICGYEIARRVQDALGGYDEVNDHGWHSTGVCGTFGAAVGAAVILGLEADRLCSAIGLAGSFTGGTWAFIAEGAMSKRMHVGRAAETGLNSALLAGAGFTGPHDLFEAPWGGFLKLYGGGGANAEALYASLGSQWQVERSSIKPYASCRSTHSAIDAALRLMTEHDIDPDTVQHITVRTSPLIQDMCGSHDVSSLVSAQLSMPFALATAILKGGVGLDHISHAGRTAPLVTAMMKRVTLEIDPQQHGGSAEPYLTIRAGDVDYQAQATIARGAATNRLSDHETIEKFSDLASTRLPADSVNELIKRILSLESVADCRTLDALTGTVEEPGLIS